MRRFGADDETIAQWAEALGQMSKRDIEHFEVYADNWLAVSLFAACSTQWQVNIDKIVGLRYEGVKAALDMAGVRRSSYVFEQIRHMERAALEVLNSNGP